MNTLISHFISTGLTVHVNYTVWFQVWLYSIKSVYNRYDLILCLFTSVTTYIFVQIEEYIRSCINCNIPSHSTNPTMNDNFWILIHSCSREGAHHNMKLLQRLHEMLNLRLKVIRFDGHEICNTTISGRWVAWGNITLINAFFTSNQITSQTSHIQKKKTKQYYIIIILYHLYIEFNFN